MFKKLTPTVILLGALGLVYSLMGWTLTNFQLLLDIWAQQKNIHLGQAVFLTFTEMSLVVLGVIASIGIMFSKEVFRRFFISIASIKIFYYFVSFPVIFEFLRYVELQSFMRHSDWLTSAYIKDAMVCTMVVYFVFALHLLINGILIYLATRPKIREVFR